MSAGGVCLDSVLQWWLSLLRVFPVCASEPGSVFGPIAGDPDPVTSSRECVVPVCNRDLIPADSPAHCLGAWLPLPSPLLFFAESSPDCTCDQTPSSFLLSSQRPASSGSGPAPSLPPSQSTGQRQERSPSSARGRPGRSSARATAAPRRHRHPLTLPLGLCRFHHRRRFLPDS